jgi:putative transposase
MIAAQKVFTCTEAARCQPEGAKAPSHDAFTRLLARQPPDTEALWQEVKGLVNLKEGLLVLDDTTLDKPYAKTIQLVTRHWSGKHHQVVLGINLISLLWTDGRALIPTDFRVYDKPIGGKNKNQHFRDMLAVAQGRGFQPDYVLFDSWYSSLDNLKLVRSYGWRWLTRLKSNRQVNPDGRGNVALRTLEVGPEGRQVHLKGYGFIKVFRTVSPNGDAEYWATNDLDLGPSHYEQLSKEAWSIESYHRGIKQCCGVEKAQVRSASGQVRHISFSLRAFVRLEVHRLKTGVSWYEAKTTIIRDAVKQYLAQPLYLLNSTA